MIATILSLNGGLLTTILCIDNQYLVTINSQIKLSVCLSVCLSILTPTCQVVRQCVPFYDGQWFNPAGVRTHDLPHKRRTR